MKTYQEEAARLAAKRQHLALLLAPGDGKTVAALTALFDAHALPALVVAPALVVEEDVWGDEAQNWQHLEQLRVLPAVGTPHQRREALSKDADIHVVSYENLLWLTDEVEVGQKYAAVVFDELSKMKHAGTKRFRRARSARRGLGAVGFRLGLTGSPVGNHLLDLWGELHMVHPGALGDTFTGFRDEHFEPRDRYARVWTLKGMHCARCRGKATRCYYCRRPFVHTAESRRHERAIQQAAAPWVYTRPEGAREGVPPVREVVRRVTMPAELERVSRDLRRQLWTRLPSGAELEALSASVVAMKLRQLAGGAVYRTVASVQNHGVVVDELTSPEWEAVHDAKLRALLDLVDELQGEPVIVYYWFKHELARLREALAGRVAEARDLGALKAWNARGLDVLLAHPQSAGLGLNLQAGGHHVAWFTLPWARWEYDQGCARLARLGQEAPEVTSHVLLCGPVDDDVWEVLKAKGDTERRFIDAVRP